MKKAGDFVLLEAGQKIRIIYSEKENSAVKCAIRNLAEDIKKVCDCVVEPGNITGRTAQENGPEIIVATMDTPWFSEIMPEAALQPLQKHQGSLQDPYRRPVPCQPCRRHRRQQLLQLP